MFYLFCIATECSICFVLRPNVLSDLYYYRMFYLICITTECSICFVLRPNILSVLYCDRMFYLFCIATECSICFVLRPNILSVLYCDRMFHLFSIATVRCCRCCLMSYTSKASYTRCRCGWISIIRSLTTCASAACSDNQVSEPL